MFLSFLTFGFMKINQIIIVPNSQRDLTVNNSCLSNDLIFKYLCVFAGDVGVVLPMSIRCLPNNFTGFFYRKRLNRRL